MVKSVLREVFFMFLIIVAILFGLGVLFYDHIPINKVVPNKVSYKVSEDIKEELETSVELQEMQEQTISYSVSAHDLRQYEQSGDYVKGNPNPFQAYNFSGNTTIIDGNGTTSEGGNTSTLYYPNTSTK